MSNIATRRYENHDWDTPFDPNQYRNKQAITMLYEKSIQLEVELAEIKEENEALREKNNTLDKEYALKEQELDSFRKQSWETFILQVIAVIVMPIGVNLLTGEEDVVIYGGMFVVIAVALEVVAFFKVRSETKN